MNGEYIKLVEASLVGDWLAYGHGKLAGKNILALAGRAMFDSKFRNVLGKVYNEYVSGFRGFVAGDDIMTVNTFHRLYNLGKIGPLEYDDPEKELNKNYKNLFPSLSESELKYFLDKIGATTEWKTLDNNLAKWIETETMKKNAKLIKGAK